MYYNNYIVILSTKLNQNRSVEILFVPAVDALSEVNVCKNEITQAS
jgi:hypothetical protein